MNELPGSAQVIALAATLDFDVRDVRLRGKADTWPVTSTSQSQQPTQLSTEITAAQGHWRKSWIAIDHIAHVSGTAAKTTKTENGTR